MKYLCLIYDDEKQQATGTAAAYFTSMTRCVTAVG